jgi:hypothetical protein
LEKIFRGLYPRTPEGRGEGRGEKKGEDREGKGRERRGEGGEGRGGRGGEEGRGYSPSKNVCLSSPLVKHVRFVLLIAYHMSTN